VSHPFELSNVLRIRFFNLSNLNYGFIVLARFLHRQVDAFKIVVQNK